MPPKTKPATEEEDHICVKIIINDDKHDLFLLNGKSYSVPVSSLTNELDTSVEIKGTFVETLLRLEQGRPFPVQAEVMPGKKTTRF